MTTKLMGGILKDVRRTKRGQADTIVLQNGVRYFYRMASVHEKEDERDE